MSPPRTRAALASCPLLLLALARPAAADPDPPAPGEPALGPWQVVRVHDGVTVKKRKVTGNRLEEFRGELTIERPIGQVLPVLEAMVARRETEACPPMTVVPATGEPGHRAMLVYDRTPGSWPVADRDAVLRADVFTDYARHRVRIDFRSIEAPCLPEVPGVIRMKAVRGHYLLSVINDGAWTEVDYQVHADAGGSLPSWAATSAARALPYKALAGLRKQVGDPRHRQVVAQMLARPDYAALVGARPTAPGPSAAADRSSN